MLNKLIFYNHFGHGDLHESREFVKDIIRLIPANEYFYAHGKDPEILRDIPNLKHDLVDSNMYSMSPFSLKDGILYINTWIGRDSRYVLPGIGCTIEKNHEMLSDILRKACGIGLSGPPQNYIPRIDYTFFNTNGIADFARDCRKKVLICNGNVQSNQAYNFDFSKIIERLATDNADIDFITTQKIDFKRGNLFYTGEITKVRGCDLNEISFLSTFCDVIVGRSSGPFLFCQTHDNWMDPDKKFISFTYTREGSNIVHNIPVNAGKIWSSSINEQDIFETISKEL